ncbi:hypothetical protein Dfer_1396 [Dyadobacter fermentans DSM 18053]|uniref:Lipoprotein n=2 Tax=Dyadobacter fermentans TaxID=94254 RepID=C6W734_DYAFD|nr:hypothetical protein Dfer_1396 [Dyadobacter fermentans DSM 18053]
MKTTPVMKRFWSIACLVFLAAWQISCSKDDPQPEPKPEPVKLNKDSVMFASYFPQYVAEAYRFNGKDSVDIMNEVPLFNTYRNSVSLQFFFTNGYINFWSLSPLANTEFPGTALTFNMQIRTNQPTGLRVAWDEEKETLVVESVSTSSYLPMIIPGKKAYLDPATFKYCRTRQDAQASKVKPKMVFVYDDEDPKLGKVTYKITLKPLYEYYREEYQQTYAKFVVF